MIRRTQSITDGMQANRLKQLSYFKELLKNYDFALVKQFIHEQIEIIVIHYGQTYMFEEGYRYISGGNWDIPLQNVGDLINLKLGQTIDECYQTIIPEEEIKIYKISLKAQLVLKKLFFLDIPILSKLKCNQKLNLLMKCRHLTLNFGSYIYRKGEEITSLYFVIAGEIKVMNKKNERIIDLGTVEENRMFGVYCLKHGRTNRQVFTKSNQNGSEILQLPINQLQCICEQKQISFSKLLQNIKSQLFSMNKFWAIPIRKSVDIEETRQSELTFSSRIKEYNKEKNIKSKQMEDLIQTKSLIFKIKDLNTIRKKQKKEKWNTSHQKYAFDISDDVKCKKMSPIISATSTPKVTFNNAIIRNFVGLTRSPSVRTFISRMSKRA